VTTPEAAVAGRPRVLPAGLDPVLPDLSSGLDPTLVATRLEHDFARESGGAALATCEPEHIRWTPGMSCVATYRLTAGAGSRGEPAGPGAGIRPPGSPGSNLPLGTADEVPHATIGVSEIGPDGSRYRLYRPDAGLPGLEAASDPTEMAAWFARLLGRPVTGCSVTPVTYRAGLRCVLRYRVAAAPDITLYGKVLAAGEAEQLAATVASLGPSLVPALVGFDPHWHLVVTADAGVRSLTSVIAGESGPVVTAALEAAGRLLSHLHARDEPIGHHRPLADDADDLTGYLTGAERIAPSVAAGLAEGIDRLRAAAEPAGPSVPSHGAFRLDQVFVTGTGVKLIDLDSFCWAEPARDIGNLLAYLQWRAIRRPAGEAAPRAMAATFAAGYGRQRPLDHDRVAVYQAASLLKIAGRRYRALAVQEWDLVPQLIGAALELLAAPARSRH
jgi:hypothetical protein